MLRPLLFSIFTNDFSFCFKNATVIKYEDDSTVYDSSCDILSNILSEELQAVFDWVPNNKLVINLKKTKSIILESKFKLRENPELNLVIKDIGIDQVK